MTYYTATVEVVRCLIVVPGIVASLSNMFHAIRAVEAVIDCDTNGNTLRAAQWLVIGELTRFVLLATLFLGALLGLAIPPTLTALADEPFRLSHYWVEHISLLSLSAILTAWSFGEVWRRHRL